MSKLLSSVRPYTATSASILALLVLTYAANQSALSAFWRFDDGWLLDYASRFSPADYFLVPAITRGYSFNNLTPFNPFIYDINLWLFGVSPRGFYIQHLAVMAGCSIATFLLLRIWLSPLFALTGAVLFLFGAPSLIVTQQLMVGHYLAGLMFSLFSVYFFVHGVEKENRLLTLAALLLYMLASTCKEIYVPLPAILLFMPKATPGRRLIHAAPMFAWTLCYTLWRYLVLGSLIGGYDTASDGSTWPEKLHQVVGIPDLLFGHSLLSIATMAIIVALTGYALYRKRLSLPLMGVTAAAVLLPMVPLLGFPGITRADRYLFLPWWLISIISAIAIASLPSWRYPYRTGISLFLILGIAIHAYQARSGVEPRFESHDTVYRLFTSQSPNTLFFSHNKNAYHQETVLNGIRNAINRVDGAGLQRVGILTQKENIHKLDNQYSIVQYDKSCNCIRETEAGTVNGGRANDTPRAQLLQVALAPPYPPLFGYADGEIEHISMEESDLRLAGWIELRKQDVEQQLLLVTPVKAEQTHLTLVKIDTHNQLTQRYGFDLRLNYRDHATAEITRSRLCLLTRSMLTPVGLIRNSNPDGCSGFISYSR